MIPSQLDFRPLKRHVSIERLLAAKGLLETLTKRADRWIGPCPLHGGHHPRAFLVTPSKNLGYCFPRCRAAGDVVELARRLLHLSYIETAHFLASLAQNAPKHRP